MKKRWKLNSGDDHYAGFPAIKSMEMQMILHGSILHACTDQYGVQYSMSGQSTVCSLDEVNRCESVRSIKKMGEKVEAVQRSI